MWKNIGVFIKHEYFWVILKNFSDKITKKTDKLKLLIILDTQNSTIVRKYIF